jgi:hypothetical protein
MWTCQLYISEDQNASKKQKDTLFWIHVCGINSKHSDIFKKGGYISKIITKLYVTHNDDTISFCYKSLVNNIGCDAVVFEYYTLHSTSK